MIPVTQGRGLGVAGVSAGALGDLGAVRKDREAIKSAKFCSERLIEITRIIKTGKETLRYIPAYVEVSK
jgi:hypothetical protein